MKITKSNPQTICNKIKVALS